MTTGILYPLPGFLYSLPGYVFITGLYIHYWTIDSLPAFLIIGRDGVIRTLDPLHPMQVRYQAAPRPEPRVIISVECIIWAQINALHGIASKASGIDWAS